MDLFMGVNKKKIIVEKKNEKVIKISVHKKEKLYHIHTVLKLYRRDL